MKECIGPKQCRICQKKVGGSSQYIYSSRSVYARQTPYIAVFPAEAVYGLGRLGSCLGPGLRLGPRFGMRNVEKFNLASLALKTPY